MLPSQLDVSEWPEFLNEEIAMFSAVPSEISAFSGIEFQRSFDSLDVFEGAVLQIGDELVALIHYPNAPVPGTIAVVAGCIDEEEKERLLSALMALAGLSDSLIIWRPSA
jgi:hypothetical protein